MKTSAKNRWTIDSILEVMNRPLLDLVFEAAATHREYHRREVQLSKLISLKTGGCPEDCAYCPQAARYSTGVKRQGLLSKEEVMSDAVAAKERGVSRICMGAAWRQVKDGKDFDHVLDVVRDVAELGVEVCCTLGMLNEDQARRLEEAGLYAYNHNIDSSGDFYKSVITTRHYQDRLNTLGNVRKTSLSLCSGGIIGMGESLEDRAGMLLTLTELDSPPESIPINALVPVKGTPLGIRDRIDPLDFVRMIATTRLVFPRSMVRLSAGRQELGETGQALCFLAGANSIFSGDKLLTTSNPSFDSDLALLDKLGLKVSGAVAQ